MLDHDPEKFRKLVDKSLRRHYEMICRFHDRGTYFFDYGNSFLKAVFDAGVRDVCRNGENDLDGFVFPSYVEDILGPCLFDFGYGPFRWCCLSGRSEDLDKTDAAAAEYILAHNRRYQDYDNYVWVRDAKRNRMVVGTQCRILYQDAMGRMNIALKFNEMVRNGEIGPVMLGRDHHDTGGTDSPFRETSNIKDGSNIMADMATQCYAGNAARGMSLIALHNGGGVGIGKSINGGFGMVLDGSERVDTILRMSMPWDTMVGVARRSWARNDNAVTTAMEYNRLYAGAGSYHPALCRSGGRRHHRRRAPRDPVRRDHGYLHYEHRPAGHAPGPFRPAGHAAGRRDAAAERLGGAMRRDHCRRGAGDPCSGGGRPGHRRRGTAGDPGTGGRPYAPDLRRVAAE